jgi:ABC-2 type transport system permease protein
MTHQLRSELRKMRTTATTGALLAGAAALALFGVCVEGLSRPVEELARENVQRELLSAGTVGVFFAALAGLISVTSEYRYGTIRPTLLLEPRRRVVLAAKLAAAALAGTIFAATCAGVSFAAGLAILAARNVDVAVTGPHALALALGPVGAGVLSAMAGVAVGALIRNQAGAIVALAAYAVLIDAVMFAAAPSVGRYLPGKAGDALAGRPDALLLAPATGAAVLALWTLAFVAAATVRSDRSDV